MNLLKVLPLLAMLSFCVGCQLITSIPHSSSTLSTSIDAHIKNVNEQPPSQDADPYKELLTHANMQFFNTGRNSYDTPIPPQIILGGLPKNLPFSLPLPTEARIIGSISTLSEDSGSVYATTLQSSDEVWEFFRAEFEQLGYKNISNLVPMEFTTTHYLLCGPAPNIEVEVVLYETESGTTNIQIHVSKSPNGGPCLANSLAPTNQGADFPLPQLSPPPDVSVQDLWGRDVIDAYAHLLYEVEGLVSASQLFDHYSQQLMKQGWQQVDTQELSNSLWSQWIFGDASNNEWSGYLYILPADSSQNNHLVLIRVLRMPK